MYDLKSSSGVAAASRNACKLCAPLGACLAFRGIEAAVPILHGSQGCATYIRRYIISHTKEPMDIASSSFDETATVFGGRENLRAAIGNVIHQYNPALIGIATTCLAETMGEDAGACVRELLREDADAWPALVHVATPSYAGTHAEGYFRTVRACVEQLAAGGESTGAINVLPGMISPADLRYLREILEDFGAAHTIFPDYADTLDGPAWEDYQLTPPGGVCLADIRRMGAAAASIELGGMFFSECTAGAVLEERHHIARHALHLPISVRHTDAFFDTLHAISGKAVPAKHVLERGRLIDSYIDAHKHVFGRRAVLYGEADLVEGIASLLAEIGMIPVVCATGGKTGGLLERAICGANPEWTGRIAVIEDTDFASIEEAAEASKPDLIIGSSKGYPLARKMNVPLVRAGFPIHDRFGGNRLLHIGYRGAQQLYDRITDALIEAKQERSPVGYFYM